jgi:putative FmdB family regulatory protein
LPTYEYACTACGHRLEAVQSFTDDPLTECPDCGGALRKVYGAVGIVLKGSGFYKTDSRAASGAGGSGKKSGGAEGQSGDTSASDSSPKKDASADKSGSGSGGSEKSSPSKDAAPASSTAS